MNVFEECEENNNDMHFGFTVQRTACRFALLMRTSHNAFGVNT